MKTTGTWRWWYEKHGAITAVGAGILSALLAVYFYRGMLDPRDADWLLHEGDSFQHYIGWQFFRQEPWGWPLGAVKTLATELSTSIVYTDSIPLYAIPLKLFHHWLPDTFQYLGLAIVINYCLNGLVACRLLLSVGVPAYAALAGALLISSLPIVILRGIGIQGHEALTAHWIILIAIELTLTTEKQRLKGAACWLLLLTVAVLMHFYLFFMAGVFWAVWWLSISYRVVKGAIDAKSKPVRQQTMSVLYSYQAWWLMGVATPCTILVVMWGAGYFHLDSQSAASGGYGFYSAELLTFFNPRSSAWFFNDNFTSLSVLFPGWQPAKEGQYEGMAYVGAGVLLLWLALIVSTWFNREVNLASVNAVNNDGYHQEALVDHRWLPAWIASVGLFGFAMAGEVSIGQGSIPLYYDMLFEPFKDYLRSSGRMVWPLLYLLLVITFIQLAQNMRACWLLPLLVLAMVVQREDLRELYSFMRNKVKNQVEASRVDPRAYDVLKDDELSQVWASHDSLIAFPAHDLDAIKPYLWLAAEHHLSINVAYLARANQQIIDAATQTYRRHLAQGELPEGHVYLITDHELSQQACRLASWACVTHENVTILWQPVAVSSGRYSPLSSQATQ